MKYIVNRQKRKKHFIIATVIVCVLQLLSVIPCISVAYLDLDIIPQAILLLSSFVCFVFILPKLFIKLHDVIYNFLNRNIDIIEKNLSYDYKPIFLDISCLKKSAISLHSQRMYFAKLEKDGAISIKIKTKDCEEEFTENTSDYSWFLSVFHFQ